MSVTQEQWEAEEARVTMEAAALVKLLMAALPDGKLDARVVAVACAKVAGGYVFGIANPELKEALVRRWVASFRSLAGVRDQAVSADSIDVGVCDFCDAVHINLRDPARELIATGALPASTVPEFVRRVQACVDELKRRTHPAPAGRQ